MGIAVRAIGIATVPLIVVAAAVGTLVHATPAGAQEPVARDDGPRFLVATADHRLPVEAEVSKIPLLRRHISLVLNDASLPDALKALKHVAGIELVYSPGVVRATKRVTLRAENMTVAAVLTDLLIDARVDVLLSGGAYVTLVPRGAAAVVPTGAIVGRVTDVKTGHAIGSADVFLNDTKWRTSTDTGGRYRFPEIGAGAYTLIVRRLGYAKQSRAVTVREGQTDTVDVALAPVATRLNELIATATGPRRRLDIANDITTINADSVMQAAPIRSLTDLLDTRVPGLTVQRTSGAPGDPARLRLRGASSPLRSNDPIVIVDGVRIYSEQSAARGANLAAPDGFSGRGGFAAPSPLDYLDPNTIETIEVLKGPSAATLYGQDAANGVIVITTKKGRPGPAHWTASAEHGRTQMAEAYPELVARAGRSLYDNSFTFCPISNMENGVPCVGDSLMSFQLLNDPVLTVLDHGTRNTLALGVEGGTPALRYAVTGSYADETGLIKLPAYEADRYQAMFGFGPPNWMRRPERFTRWSVASNLTAKLGEKAELTLGSQLARLDQQRSTLEQQLGVLMTVYLDRSTGTYYGPQFALPPEAPLEPHNGALFKDYYQRGTAGATQLTNRMTLNWRPRAWLTVTSDAGVDVIHRTDQVYFPRGPIRAIDPATGTVDSLGSVNDAQGTSIVPTVNVRSVAQAPFGHGFVFHFGAGLNYTGTTTRDLAGQTSVLAPGSSVQGAVSCCVRQAAASDATFGWYAEPSVGNNKLNFTSGLRLDGGANYGGHVTGLSLPTFPKLGASYLVSDEPWFPLKTLVSSLRVRAAYGKASRQPGPKDRLRLYDIPTEQYVDGALQVGVALQTLGNTEVRPERSTELEGGFDADLLDSRLTVTLSGYRKTTDDALLRVPVAPSVYGDAVSILKNIGVTRNTGLELLVGGDVVRSGPLTWHTQLQVSQNRNVVVSLGPGVAPFFTEFDAPDRDQDLLSSGLRVAAGYPLFGRWTRPVVAYADANGDGILQRQEIQLGDTMVYVGATIPNYTANLATTLSFWRGALTVNAGLSYVDGLTQLNQLAQGLGALSRGQQDPTASLAEQLATKSINDVAGGLASDYNWIQTVSTVRFESLSVRYLVPAGVARRLGAQNVSVAVQGGNLGFWTNYRGVDPNVNAFGTGNNVTDTGILPQPRTWQVRVQATY